MFIYRKTFETTGREGRSFMWVLLTLAQPVRPAGIPRGGRLHHLMLVEMVQREPLISPQL